MAKKEKTEKVQSAQEAKPQAETAVVNNEAQTQESAEVKERKISSPSVITDKGHVIDGIQTFVRKEDGAMMVKGEYGKVKEGDPGIVVGAEKLIAHPIPEIHLPEYNALFRAAESKKEAPNEAKIFAAQVAFPMFIHEDKFMAKEAEINGRKVDYINVETLTEDKLIAQKLKLFNLPANEQKARLAALSEDERAAALKGSEKLVGRWQLSFGEKGNKDSRFVGIMNREEVMSFKARADVQIITRPAKDAEGKKILKQDGSPVMKDNIITGKSITLAELAGKVENRVKEARVQQQLRQASLESASKVDWSKFKLPENVSVSKLRFADSEYPGRAWITGKVMGGSVVGLLTTNETAAVKNKLATLEQVAAANKDFSKKVNALSKNFGDAVERQDAALAAVVSRATESGQKSFTPAQVDVLVKYVSSADTAEEREQLFEALFEDARPAMDKAGALAEWQADVREELKGIANGELRSEEQGITR